MEIESVSDGPVAHIRVIGRVDTATAPQLQEYVAGMPASVESLAMDCSELEYLSSAGLRALLLAHKRFAAKGNPLVLENVSSAVRDVLDLTGFSAVFDVRS